MHGANWPCGRSDCAVVRSRERRVGLYDGVRLVLRGFVAPARTQAWLGPAPTGDGDCAEGQWGPEEGGCLV